MAKAFPGRSFLATFGLVIFAIAALSVIDMFLAKMEQTESLVEANRLFVQGKALMQRGKNLEAIGRLRDAISLERGNRTYLQTLAQAQAAAGQTADAKATLTELLRSDSTDGLSALIMARVLAKEGLRPEAVSYFHQAIHGRWKSDAEQNRLRARYELIDLLAESDSKEELLAELLPIQERAPLDIKVRLHIGRLFLLAESPTRAGDVFRAIVRDAPGNADAYEGLGEAEFVRGNYRAAQRHLQTALRLGGDAATVRQRLDLCNQLITLDPNVRGIGAAERARRALKLVDLAFNEAKPCLDQHPSEESKELLNKAEHALKTRGSPSHQTAESNLDLAEQLAQAQNKECKSSLAGNTPLALALAKLGR